MNLGMSGVNHQLFKIRVVNDDGEQSLPCAFVPPPTEATMRILPVSVFRRQIASWRSYTQYPHHRINEQPVILCCTTTVMKLAGKMRSDYFP